MALVIRPSRIHAAGVFTTAPIRKGSRVVEYSGPRLSPEEANRLYDGAARTYLYGLEDGKTVIDGEGWGTDRAACDLKRSKAASRALEVTDSGPEKSDSIPARSGG